MHTRQARIADIPDIMTIIAHAKERIRRLGISQWQDGYPNEEAIRADIAHKEGIVMVEGDAIIAYAAVIFREEPTYAQIDGRWMSDSPYVVVHRIAVRDGHTRCGVAKHLMKDVERRAARRHVAYFRIDTHQGNHHMRNLIRGCGFILCGIVQVRDGKRMAYEKYIG
ncbi:MAG: GNAT family N-acetyltransferase [Bacteroidales bacterium]|nr:GNAT family N-acetyltransferase [Bacteroidales bacterium]